jgi:hypothetical protein
MDNMAKYGFRWSISANSHPCPNPLRRHVADGYQAKADNTTSNVDLNIGDPVKIMADGTVALANTGEAVEAIITGIEPYWNGSAMQPTNRLPGGTTGGGLFERKSAVLIVPANSGYWEADMVPLVVGGTEALYEAMIGENIDHVIVADVSNPSQPKANPKLSGVHTSVSAQWRFMGIATTFANQDFAGNNVKMLVRINESTETPAANVVGV